jgi:hypothetical protein
MLAGTASSASVLSNLIGLLFFEPQDVRISETNRIEMSFAAFIANGFSETVSQIRETNIQIITWNCLV